jgi:hypothetical protein
VELGLPLPSAWESNCVSGSLEGKERIVEGKRKERRGEMNGYSFSLFGCSKN